MPLTPKEADTLFDEEISYSSDHFTRKEIKTMRMLCRDRAENRFKMAAKAANEMNLSLLVDVVNELMELDELGTKFMEMTDDN